MAVPSNEPPLTRGEGGIFTLQAKIRCMTTQGVLRGTTQKSEWSHDEELVASRLRKLQSESEQPNQLDGRLATNLYAHLITLILYLRVRLYSMCAARAHTEEYAAGAQVYMRQRGLTIMENAFQNGSLFPRWNCFDEVMADDVCDSWKRAEPIFAWHGQISFKVDGPPAAIAAAKWEFVPVFQTRETFLAMMCLFRGSRPSLCLPIELADKIAEYLFSLDISGPHNELLSYGRRAVSLLGEVIRKGQIIGTECTVTVEYR